MFYIRKTLATCALATSLALSPVIVGLAAEPPHPGSGAAVTAATIGITNFGQVSQTYFRGSQPTGADYTNLAALGVKTVIDLQEDGLATEPKLVEAAGMRFYRIPMNTRRPPTSAEQAQFLKLVNDPANQPVYVHCAGGRHRTGVMTAIYRMTSDGWNSEKAFREMKQYDFGADFLHPEFKKFVYAYRVDPTPATPTTIQPSLVAPVQTADATSLSN